LRIACRKCATTIAGRSWDDGIRFHRVAVRRSNDGEFFDAAAAELHLLGQRIRELNVGRGLRLG
jgi:hypothetical protein